MSLCTTPIGQPLSCEAMTWLCFVLVQSVFVFVWFTLTTGMDTATLESFLVGPVQVECVDP